MQLKNWPDDERPREKLLALGCEHLSDAELLAIFLRTGIRGLNAVELSRHLLLQFGNLRALLSAPIELFCDQKGLGSAKYAQLQASLEMSRRYLSQQAKTIDVLASPQVVKELLKSKLQDEENEVFAILYLDSNHGILHYEALFKGTIDGAMVYPRVVIKKVLEHKATSVIFAHNHPSGASDPSRADLAITERLKKALDLIDVRVLDHFIVGHEVISFSERGLI